MVLDSVHVELGASPDQAYGAQALAIYEELGDLSRQATMALNLGGRAYYEARWQEALSSYERARDLYGRTGNSVSAADATFNIAELLSQQGRLEEAETLLRDVARVWRAAGDRVGVALAESELARVAYRAGRHAEALPRLERARVEFQATGAEGEARETDLRIAECLLVAHETGRALALLDPALDRARAKGELAGVRVSRVQRLRGSGLVQEGRWQEAKEAFEESIDAGRLEGTAYEVALSLGGLARVARATGSDEAEALATESAEILARLGVVAAG
jgi:tetratricopeptide (TPR) repeat protein